MTEFTLDDVETIEGGEAEPIELARSLQRAINGGMWKLQGSYGRAMMGAIEAGECLLGRAPASDYYGNRIPSRDQVEAGTKGSRAFVVAQKGEDWAAAMEEA